MGYFSPIVIVVFPLVALTIGGIIFAMVRRMSKKGQIGWMRGWSAGFGFLSNLIGILAAIIFVPEAADLEVYRLSGHQYLFEDDIWANNCLLLASLVMVGGFLGTAALFCGVRSKYRIGFSVGLAGLIVNVGLFAWSLFLGIYMYVFWGLRFGARFM